MWGWIGTFTSWLGSLVSLVDRGFKALMRSLVNKLYLIVAPAVAVCKLIFDFIKETINLVIDKIESFSSFSASGGGLTAIDAIQFVNYAFPIDETLLSLSLLFTFFIGCQIIASIRGIKQTILF